MSRDIRWLVSYAPDFATARTVTFVDGEFLLRRDVLRLILFNSGGGVVDARALRESEFVDIGHIVSFPCFFTRVSDRIPAITAAVPVAGHGAGDTYALHGTGVAVHGDGATHRAAADGSLGVGPRGMDTSSMADANHVDGDPGPRTTRSDRVDGIKAKPHPPS